MRVNLTLGKIVEMVGGDCSLDHSFLVQNIASLENAGPQDLAVVIGRGDASVFDAVAKEAINKTDAALILAEKPLAAGKNYLIVPDPLKAYQKIIRTVGALKKAEQAPGSWVSAQAKIGDNVVIGPNAVIDDGACVGDNTQINAQAYVGKDCIIGANVIIHAGAKVLDRCSVGDHSVIHSGTVIGSDGFGYQVNKTGMQKIPHIGSVSIGDHVEIGANCSVDRAAFNKTVIGNGVKIDNNVHIAHGVSIGDHSAILALTGIAGSAKIGAGCQIGGLVGIRDHITIGDGAKVVSGSGVLKDVKPGAVVAGTPAMPFTKWKRGMVAFTRLPELMKKAAAFSELMDSYKQSWWQRLFMRK